MSANLHPPRLLPRRPPAEPPLDPQVRELVRLLGRVEQQVDSLSRRRTSPALSERLALIGRATRRALELARGPAWTRAAARRHRVEEAREEGTLRYLHGLQLQCLEELTKLTSPVLLYAGGELEWISESAEQLFREVTGSPAVPSAIDELLAEAPAPERHVLVAGSWLRVQRRPLSVGCDDYELLVLDDPAARQARQLARRYDKYGLSAREREVADLLTEGLSVRRIAERLELSYHTVNNHTRRIYDRSGVRNRHELLSLLLDDG